MIRYMQYREGFGIYELPVPPSINNQYKPVVRNRFASIILTAEARKYHALVDNLLNESGVGHALAEWMPEDTPLQLRITHFKQVYTKDGSRLSKTAGDSDNRVKLLKDILFKNIGRDDYVVKEDIIAQYPHVEPSRADYINVSFTVLDKYPGHAG